METYIITDLGNIEFTDTATNEKLHIGRYGVWLRRNGHKDEVIEVSDDLKELTRKYPTALIHKLEVKP